MLRMTILRTTVCIDHHGIPLDVEVLYSPAEPPIHWPTEHAHPGSPALVDLQACFAGKDNILKIIKPAALLEIEAAVFDRIEAMT